MKRAVAVLLVLAGCGDDGPPEWCAAPSGLYEMTMTPESGNCSTGVIQAIVTLGGPAMVQGCVGDRSVSANNCEISLDITCPAEGGGTSKTTGKVAWNEDGGFGAGRLYMVLNQGINSCDGIFRVTYTRL